MWIENDDFESQMSQRERLSIDIGDLKERVEKCRTDAAWEELPLSAKLRVLIKERLEQLEQSEQQREA